MFGYYLAAKFGEAIGEVILQIVKAMRARQAQR
jgi:hypothetical protein